MNKQNQKQQKLSYSCTTPTPSPTGTPRRRRACWPVCGTGPDASPPRRSRRSSTRSPTRRALQASRSCPASGSPRSAPTWRCDRWAPPSTPSGCSSTSPHVSWRTPWTSVASRNRRRCAPAAGAWCRCWPPSGSRTRTRWCAGWWPLWASETDRLSARQPGAADDCRASGAASRHHRTTHPSDRRDGATRPRSSATVRVTAQRVAAGGDVSGLAPAITEHRAVVLRSSAR